MKKIMLAVLLVNVLGFSAIVFGMGAFISKSLNLLAVAMDCFVSTTKARMALSGG